MIGSEFTTTIFPPREQVSFGRVPLHVMAGRARCIYAMFGCRWPSEN